MTDNTRFALVDASGKVVNVTNIGLIFERVPKIEADGITVTYTDTQVETTVVPAASMIVPGDKLINGQFVKSNSNSTQQAVIRNRDGVILHFVDFPSEIVSVVPDPEGEASPGVTTWDGQKFVNPTASKPAAAQVAG